jgi:hypothetical protein
VPLGPAPPPADLIVSGALAPRKVPFVPPCLGPEGSRRFRAERTQQVTTATPAATFDACRVPCPHPQDSVRAEIGHIGTCWVPTDASAVAMSAPQVRGGQSVVEHTAGLPLG